MKILVIEDEPDVVDLITINLATAGFEVMQAYDGEQGLELAFKQTPDLILLDLMLPKRSGLEVCKELKSRQQTSKIPVIMLTAKGSEEDRVTGFESGADDYVVKPFSVRELMLRVKSILRRQNEEEKTPISFTIGEITLDEGRHQVQVEGEEISLTPTEFKLLSVLMERQGLVQTRERLLCDVWEYDQAIDTRTVDTHIRRLREKLGKSAHYIDTIRGVGYRINNPDTQKLSALKNS